MEEREYAHKRAERALTVDRVPNRVVIVVTTGLLSRSFSPCAIIYDDDALLDERERRLQFNSLDASMPALKKKKKNEAHPTIANRAE